MNLSLILDWKFVLAIGGAVAIVILATKANETGAERVLTGSLLAFDRYDKINE